MINRLRLYDPDYQDLDLSKFNLDVGKLSPDLRETTVLKDQWGDYHIVQKTAGSTQAVQFDQKELMAILKRIFDLNKK